MNNPHIILAKLDDYINIGSSPVEEDCVQIGEINYMSRSLIECALFLKAIRNKLGTEPVGARLMTKRFTHDFGTYHEVVCMFQTGNEKAMEYAFKCESEAPTTWKEGGIEESELDIVRRK